MKRLIFTLYLFQVLIFNYTYGQNSIWIIGNEYITNTNNVAPPIALPSPSSTNWPTEYDGRLPELSSNAIADQNGDLAFFIIDNYIFDAEGYAMERSDLSDKGILHDGNNGSGTSPNYMRGMGEVEVIPVPNECNKYYILYHNIGQYAQSTTNYDIAYSIINLELDNTVNPNGTSKGIIENANGISLKSDLVWPKVPPLETSNIHFATTPPMASGNRLCYMLFQAGVIVYEITPTGFVYRPDLEFGYIPAGNSVFNYNGTPCTVPTYATSTPYQFNDIEIIEFSTGYRIAFSGGVNVAYGATAGCEGTYAPHRILWVIDFDSNGEIIKNTNNDWRADVIIFPPNGINQEEISGLEFTGNGRRLILNQQNRVNNQNISQYIINITGNGLLNVLHEASYTMPGYEFSKLNTGLDGKLYLGKANGLTTMNVDGTGSITGLNTSNIAFTHTPIDVATALPSSYNSAAPYYILPNQMNEDYSLRFNNPCCKSTDIFYDTYTAQQGLHNWSSTSSPFGNGNTSEVIITEELIIPNGSTVTIDNMVFRFEEGAKVTIEQGGELRLNNNTTFTSRECKDELWEGITVKGNPSFDHTNPTYHGRLQVNSGSEISYAHRGVSLYSRDANGNILYTETGGIVTAQDATFKNNVKDVEFYPYNYDNLSSFNLCNFVTDGVLPAGAQIDAHVTMFEVQDIVFTGCVFENTLSIQTYAIDRGTGIRSFDANYYVKEACSSTTMPCPAGSSTASVFRNLLYAVHAESVNPLNTMSIRNCNFDECMRGALVRGIDYFEFDLNTVDIGSTTTSTAFEYGLYVENCTGYSIQENSFTGVRTWTSGDGVVVNNSNDNGNSTDVNEIYKNTFDNLENGISSIGYNVGTNRFGYAAFSGLKVKCNDFVNDGGTYSIGVEEPGGIGPLQGNCNLNSTAQNTFNTVNLSFEDIFNEVGNVSNITYAQDQAALGSSPSLYNLSNTSMNVCTSTTTCPSNFSGGGQSSAKMMNQQTTESEAESMAESSLGLMNYTDSLFNLAWDVKMNGASTWAQFKDDVLQYSPYLSTVDLQRVLDNSNTVPAGVIKEVLIANSPLTPEILNLVYNSALSSGVKSDIYYAQTQGENPRYEIEKEYYYALGLIRKYKNDHIRRFMHDKSIVNRLDSISDVFMSLEDELFEEQMINLEINRASYSNAQNKINNLRTNNSNSDDFADFREVLVEFEKSPEKSDLIMRDTVLKQIVIEKASKSMMERSSFEANLLLARVGGYKIAEQEPNLQGAKQAQITTQDYKEILSKTGFVVYPNPTDNGVTIESTKAYNSIEVFDLNGKIVKSYSSNQSYIGLTDLSNGLYLIKVNYEDGTHDLEKIKLNK